MTPLEALLARVEAAKAGDRLRMDHINSLPQPFLARFVGDTDWWPVNDFEVETALMRIDVCGKLQVKGFSEVAQLRDGDGVEHDPETFYTDWKAGVKALTEAEIAERRDLISRARLPVLKAEGSIYEHMAAEIVGNRGIAQVWAAPDAWVHTCCIVSAANDYARLLDIAEDHARLLRALISQETAR